jgi:hypothetical protein
MTAWQVNPGNALVVHHALVYVDAAAESERRAAVGDSYPCFGGPGIGDPALIGAWAPGTGRQQLPEQVATRIPAGSRLVMQIHYHPLDQPSEPDATAFEFWTVEEPPVYESQIFLIGNFEGPERLGGLLPGPEDDGNIEFRIPAGTPSHVESMTFRMPTNVPELMLWSVGTHMHYVGTDMKIDVERRTVQGDEPESECLVQTPRWDFNWQRGYVYDAPLDQVPRINRGDNLVMRCTYDNSPANPALARALSEAGLDAPIDVRLGEETLDEMCLGVFSLAFPR